MKYESLPKFVKDIVNLKLLQNKKTVELVQDLDISLFEFISGKFIDSTKRKYSSEKRVLDVIKSTEEYFKVETSKKYSNLQTYREITEKLCKILESLNVFAENTFKGRALDEFNIFISKISDMVNDFIYEKDEMYSEEFNENTGLHFSEFIYSPDQIKEAIDLYKKSNMKYLSKDWVKYLCDLYGMNYSICPVVLLEPDYMYSQAYLFVRFISTTMKNIADTNDVFACLAFSFGVEKSELDSIVTSSPKLLNGKEYKRYFEDIVSVFMSKLFSEKVYQNALLSLDKNILPYTKEWFDNIKRKVEGDI